MIYLYDIFPKIPQYHLARANLLPPALPFNLTFSVTNICQSRCKTCNIWEIYQKNPAKRAEELSVSEIEKIFKSMGHVYIFNVSGGEPFLRPDFVEIIELACKHLQPGVIHIPTNAIAKKRVLGQTRKIIELLKSKYPSTRLTIKPSLDHIGQRHDEIRGVPGNFDKVMSVFDALRAMKPGYENLHVELGTVISRWNVDDIEEIAGFITKLDTDSYRNEIAEQRNEMLNMQDSITPDPDQYRKAIRYFVAELKRNMKNNRMFNRITNAFRLEYYDLAIRILDEQKQVISCYAGISNAHMTPYGDIWACCTLGYEQSMGSLRDYQYDFKRLWRSKQAEQVRAYIKAKNCFCPMANQMYSNILLHTPSLMRVLKHIATA
jgi:MoaA/NifB/PqqE/SkfB family radical SAM enzyme